MSNQEQRLFCSLDNSNTQQKKQNRLEIINQLGLLTPETVPICEEAIQMVVRFLEIPICFLGLMLQDNLWLKSALGLSQLGFMNPIALERRISPDNSFCSYVVENEQILVVPDTLADPIYANISLVKDYGIRSYLGIPLITATGHCLGTLAVMDLAPHSFTVKDQDFLALTARWCLREVESKYYLLNSHHNNNNHLNNWQKTIDLFQVEFFHEVIENLRAPLTNIIGMSSVLKQETYGTLNSKQKKYLDIIYKSGHKIASLIKACSEINLLDDDLYQVNLRRSDPNLIAKEVATRLENWLELEVVTTSSPQLYLLDIKKARQALYYLIVSLFGIRENHEAIRLDVEFNCQTIDLIISLDKNNSLNDNMFLLEQKQLNFIWEHETIQPNALAKIIQEVDREEYCYNQLLQLFLSCYLAELQKGEIKVKSSEDRYQYMLRLPKVIANR